MPEQTETSELPYRINLKQNVKGDIYFDVTVRGDSLAIVESRLEELLAVAWKHVTVGKPEESTGSEG